MSLDDDEQDHHGGAPLPKIEDETDSSEPSTFSGPATRGERNLELMILSSLLFFFVVLQVFYSPPKKPDQGEHDKKQKESIMAQEAQRGADELRSQVERLLENADQYARTFQILRERLLDYNDPDYRAIERADRLGDLNVALDPNGLTPRRELQLQRCNLNQGVQDLGAAKQFAHEVCNAYTARIEAINSLLAINR